jgi:tetratricopeptide (TPR) repeat protein
MTGGISLSLFAVFMAATTTLAQEDSLRAALKADMSNAETARTWCRLAECVRKKGNYTQGRAYAVDGIGLARRIKDPVAEAECAHVLGNICRRTGEPDSALVYYARSLELWRRIGDEVGAGKSLNGLGNVHQNLGNGAEAEKCYKQAIALFEKNQQVQYWADAQNNLGALYDARGDYARAAELYLAAMTQYRRAGNELGYASALNNLGPVYQRQGDYARAEDCYRRAYHVFLRLKMPAVCADALNNLGIVFYKTERLDSAQAAFNVALDVGKKSEHDNAVANALYHLGMVAAKRDNLKTAQEYYRRAEEMYFRLGDIEGRCHALLGLADVARRQGNNAAALRSAEQSLALANEIHSLDITARAYREKAKICHDHGDHKNAYLFQVRFTQLNDSLHDYEKNRELGRLAAHYEYQKARDDERKRIEIQEQRNQRIIELQYFGLFGFVAMCFIFLFLLGRLSLSPKTARALIFICLLLAFEFTLILFDPVIDRYSNGLPVLKLGFNMTIALVVSPFYTWLENLFHRKAVGSEKMKRIL